jgi:hypothetical protein
MLCHVKCQFFSPQIFRLQKKIIRIMMGCRSKDLCRKSFFNLEILTLSSQYNLFLLLFMIRNKNQFVVNSELHHMDTRQQANFHQPSVNMAKYQKGVYCLCVKVFNPFNAKLNPICHLLALLEAHHILYISRIRVNMIPSYIKTEFDNPKKFKVVLQKFLYKNSFYSLDEYFKLQKKLKITYCLNRHMKDLTCMH